MNDRKGVASLGTVLLWCAVALIVLAVLGVVFLAGPSDDAAATAQPATVEIHVRVLDVTPRDIVDTVVLPARLEPASVVQLSSEKPGRVVELPVDKGSRVEAGQVMLKVDDRTWTNILAQAEVVSREAEKDFRRWSELEKSGSVAASDFDAVRKARDLARVAVDLAATDVAKCAVRTPVSGIVDERYVEEGEYVHEGGPVFKVVDIDSMKLIVDVPERDVPVLKTGAGVGFSLSLMPDRAFTGVVSFVSAAAEPLSNSFRVEIATGNPDHVFKGGMIAEARIERGVMKSAIVLPLAAVIPRKGEHIVFVVGAGQAERRVVTIKPISGFEALVLSGVEQGERVVIEGHRSLQDGLPVRVVE